MPVDLIYDISVERDNQAYGKCIRAPEHVFRQVAGILLKLATEKPDESGVDALDRELLVNHARQASFFSFALQCLGDALCGESEGETDMLLRQKPADNCVLQQFQDDAWVDVFDFGLCFEFWNDAQQTTSNTIDQIKNALPVAANFWQDFNDRYTGTSASYDPALTIESSNELTNRAALCAALKEQIDNYVEQSKQAQNVFTEDLSKGALAIASVMAVLAVIAAIIAWPVAAPFLPAMLTAASTAGAFGIGQASLGISTTLIALWISKVKSVDGAVLDDAGARENLLCVWYETLKNEEDISLEDYQQTLDVSATSSNTQALYDTIKPLIDQGLSYATFLDSWKRQITYGEAGLNLELCACEEYPIEVVNYGGYDNTIIEFKGINGSNQAIYDLTLPSTGLNASDGIVIRTTNTAHTYLNVFMKDTQILSGTFAPLQSNGVVVEDYAGHYDPDYEFYHWAMYALTFPAKIRLTMEIGTNP